ncbi:MAG: ATP-binding protein [Nitrososphaeraceae archaeon]
MKNNFNYDSTNYEKDNIELSCDRKLDQLLLNTEPIGTIGSPSSTSEINLNILQNAVTKKLVGELVIFKYLQDSQSNYSLGQITEIELKNALLEDPTIKSVARLRGLVNPISGIQDTHVGKLLCSAVFSSNNKENFFDTSLLGTVPPTGTFVHLTNDFILDSLLEKHLDKLFYLGYVYGSKTKLPMWFKHFSDGPNGAGEAYHIGIFGTTGSGKSTLAKMILMGYSKYPEMGLLIFDPVGEFSKDTIFDTDEIYTDRKNNAFYLNMKEILLSLGKKFEVVNIRNLILDRWDLFEELLYESAFFPYLSIKGENKRDAANILINYLRTRSHISLNSLIRLESFHEVVNILRNPNIQLLIYSTPEPRARLNTVISELDEDYIYGKIWKPICQLFHFREGAQTVDSLLKKFTMKEKPMIIVDLSLQSAHNMKLDYWNETIQALVLKRLLYGLIILGEKSWQQNSSLNTLVVLDEAHRFARREKYENSIDLENVRIALLDAVRTTRKYGLGWMFISTSLSSVHKDILQQLRIMFCGFGLSLGSDLVTMKELVSDHNAIKLYQSFTDPANSFNTKSKKYSFMSQGPVSPLSFAGTPLFLNVFNLSEIFIRENRLLAYRKVSENGLSYTQDSYDF